MYGRREKDGIHSMLVKAGVALVASLLFALPAISQTGGREAPEPKTPQTLDEFVDRGARAREATQAEAAEAERSRRAPTVDELIARNLRARGGEPNIRSISSARMEGHIRSAGIEFPFTRVWKRPNKLHVSFTVEGMTVTQATDGEQAWMIMPLTGNPRPREIDQDNAQHLLEQADFEGPLVDYQHKGNRVAFLGTEEVRGAPAYKIGVTHPDGSETFVYLDTRYFLEVKQEIRHRHDGQELSVETYYDDYKRIDGLMIAHSLQVREKGKPGGQLLRLESVQLDVPVPDTTFSMPRR